MLPLGFADDPCFAQGLDTGHFLVHPCQGWLDGGHPATSPPPCELRVPGTRLAVSSQRGAFRSIAS
eukprot:4394291-Amphidinium_carterae.1